MAHLTTRSALLQAASEMVEKYEHSPMIAERRRNLFPSKETEIDQELGHIQPLRYDTTSDSETSDNEDNNISDYELVGVLDKQGFSTPISRQKGLFAESMSPLHLSPFTKTPQKFSPSHNLKTPHDTCSKSNLPKLQRELLEESKSGKRMDSPTSSPNHTHTDVRSGGKVRTALFSDSKENELDISLSTKSFYSKTCEDISDILSTRERSLPIFTKVVPSRIGHRYNKKVGQINNGVRHKIRKRKQKKLSKASYEKASKILLKSNDAITEYIKDISELKKAPNVTQKLIENKPKIEKNNAELDLTMKNYLSDLEELNHFGNGYNKLIKHSKKETLKENKENIPLENRKRHLTPEKYEGETNKKFFKSYREKAILKIEGFDDLPAKNKEIINKNSQNENSNIQKLIENTSITSESQNNAKKITTFESLDLEIDDNEEIIPNMNIDNILTALDSQGEAPNDDDNYLNENIELGVILTATNNFNDQIVQFDTFENPSHMTHVVPTYVPDNYQNNLLTVPHGSFYDSGSPMADTLNTSFDSTSHGTETPPTQVILEAFTSIQASENSIQLHDHILSPISQMCDVTSGLALTDSPKKGRNLISVLNNMPNARSTNQFGSADMEKQRYFPLFYGSPKVSNQVGEKRTKSEGRRTPAKKFRGLAKDQMLLDAGQKKFGLIVCAECNLAYHEGDPGEEIQHQNYHSASHVLRFGGWKNEHVVADFQKNGRIIKVLPSDSKLWVKKVTELMEVVNREFGCYEMTYDISESEVYLYIKNRTIVGCVVATVPKADGHKMLSTFGGVPMCSEESYPIKCGISHIWVAPNSRQKGVATALMDAVKANFILGTILTNEDMALTSPTEAGMAFASKYFKTNNYLIYFGK